jgi:glycosyltransferase involved in cell wall biosynthesis
MRFKRAATTLRTRSGDASASSCQVLTSPYLGMRMRVLGLAYYGSWSATTRVRLAQYQAPLRTFGIDLEVRSLLGGWYRDGRSTASSVSAMATPRMLGAVTRRMFDGFDARHFDRVILTRELLPLLPARLEQALLGRPYIYDLDDANYLLYRLKGPTPRVPFATHKIDDLIRRAEVVTAGSASLAAYTYALNPQTTVLPSVVDTNRYQVGTRSRKDHVVIGWIGSPSTSKYLHAIVEPLARLGGRTNIRLRIIGARAPKIRGVVTEEYPWSESQEVSHIQSFDVGVMPLHDDEWSRGKCAFKLIQCMACGVPVVASPVGANKEVVTPECGFLADGESCWFDSLKALVEDESLRISMGRCGRSRVEGSYSLAVMAPRLARVLSGMPLQL